MMSDLQIKEYVDDANYLIYSDGRIYTKKRNRFLTPTITKYGYYKVTFNPNGKRITKALHRIIAETFIINPDNLPQVNHKDENKLNNDVSNLEFCTAKYNSNYGTRTIRSSLTRIDRAISGKPVKQIDRCGNVIAIYPSAAEASRHVHGKPSNILNICRGDPHRHYVYGYTWKFANSEELQ